MMAVRDHDGAAAIRRLLSEGAVALANAGVDNPRLDAELLMAHAAHVTRAAMLAGLVAPDGALCERYGALIRRRAAREPLAYIVGRREFYSLDLEVTPAVLIPRPETETIVAAALEFLARRGAARVLDLCTGSGAIALAIAANAPHVTVVATDLSAGALEVAQRNCIRLGLTSRVTLRRADCFSVLDSGPPLGRFDLIVSNPPYIPDAQIAGLQDEVSRYEPRVALAGGPDGLDFYRRIANGLDAYLAPGGGVIVEIGASQAAAVMNLFAAAGRGRVTMLKDLAGNPRAIASLSDLC